MAGVNPKSGSSDFTNSTWKIREFRAAARTCSPSQTFPGLLVKPKRSISNPGVPPIRKALMKFLILGLSPAYRLLGRTAIRKIANFYFSSAGRKFSAMYNILNPSENAIYSAKWKYWYGLDFHIKFFVNL